MPRHTTRRWAITADKFLSEDQVSQLIQHITRERDLAIIRANNRQAIKDYYVVRTLLETGVRVAEFCDLTAADLHGLKLSIRNGMEAAETKCATFTGSPVSDAPLNFDAMLSALHGQRSIAIC